MSCVICVLHPLFMRDSKGWGLPWIALITLHSACFAWTIDYCYIRVDWHYPGAFTSWLRKRQSPVKPKNSGVEKSFVDEKDETRKPWEQCQPPKQKPSISLPAQSWQPGPHQVPCTQSGHFDVLIYAKMQNTGARDTKQSTTSQWKTWLRLRTFQGHWTT